MEPNNKVNSRIFLVSKKNKPDIGVRAVVTVPTI